MENPWKLMPDDSPYVLKSDASAVESFNRFVQDRYRLRIESKFPEPFLGNPTAPIVLLNLNPGFADSDHMYMEDPVARSLQLGNLRHESSAYPFYHLDPRMARFGGEKWWKPRLQQLIDLVGVGVVANRILCVEFFPYSSREYKPMPRVLDSQLYGFHLVNQAIDRRALIVFMRSRRVWCDAVPRLASYDRLYECSGPRNPRINSAQLPAAFSEIERILRA